MLEVALGVFFFTAIVVTLVGLILIVRAKLLPGGDIDITVNADRITVGATIDSGSGDIFLRPVDPDPSFDRETLHRNLAGLRFGKENLLFAVEDQKSIGIEGRRLGQRPFRTLEGGELLPRDRLALGSPFEENFTGAGGRGGGTQDGRAGD